MTGLFPQLFDKTFATSQQKYFITWHDTEFFISSSQWLSPLS